MGDGERPSPPNPLSQPWERGSRWTRSPSGRERSERVVGSSANSVLCPQKLPKPVGQQAEAERQARYLSMRIGRMPQNADLYFRLADLHAAHGNRDRAVFEYQRGLRLRPSDAAARRKLATLSERR